MVGEYLDGQGMSRGDLMKWGAALGLGAAGMSAVAGGGRAVSAGAQTLEKTFGWMIAANVPFFEQTMTRWMRRARERHGLQMVTQSEDGTPPRRSRSCRT